jgi:N-acetylglucosaminyl-diphospho-decaprenol L-rhamnosyltransferase
MKSFDLAIVIVNWNTGELLRDCLASVFANTGPSFEVCVVDNASNDNSAEMVAAVFPQVHLIRNIHNAGFSRASNAGLRSFGFGTAGNADPAARYALLLNPDTAVPPDAFSRMLQFLDSRPDVGVAGPRLVRKDGTLDPACRRAFPTPALSFYHFSGLSKLFPRSRRFGRYNLSFCDPDELTEVDSVNGAFMIVRGHAVEKVGLLDEEFFFGGEDLDWAYRIKAANWKVYYYPEVCVRHVKRAAFRKNPDASYEFERAMWIFYRKHYRATTPRLLDWLIRAGLALRGGMRLVREMRRTSRLPVVKDA